jgi:hypothetical protein
MGAASCSLSIFMFLTLRRWWGFVQWILRDGALCVRHSRAPSARHICSTRKPNPSPAPAGRHIRWGEATDEPGLARQSAATTAREDQPSPSFGATGARPTKFEEDAAPDGAWEFFRPGFLQRYRAYGAENIWLRPRKFHPPHSPACGYGLSLR